jgi:solute:Na+ symporter, SSS family
MGYLAGYLVIANILMPIYYRYNLTSIYTYLDQRFGRVSYKTGAAFFLVSRMIGSSFRLFLVAITFELFLPSEWNIPFYLIVLITIVLIWLYTFQGGIKTIIWTDTLQTVFMLTSVVLTVYLLGDKMNLDFRGIVSSIAESDYSRIFFFDDTHSKNYFFKQFFAGMFITITMTGLDQDMMQKNLSCRNIGDAKKNMYWFSLALIPVNFLFLGLGALLYIYADFQGIAVPERADHLFPMIAFDGGLHPMIGIIFIVGLVAAAYSSADSALTSMTTSFSVDILNINKHSDESKRTRIRKMVHIGISLISFFVIIVFKEINNESVVSSIFTVAGYTYGPLLGLYAFGLFTKMNTTDRWVPLVAILSPFLTYLTKIWLASSFGYELGFELIILNGLICFTGLLLIRSTLPVQKRK